jgi:hypothetical protein
LLIPGECPDCIDTSQQRTVTGVFCSSLFVANTQKNQHKAVKKKLAGTVNAL